MNLRQLLDELRIKYLECGSHKNIRSGWIGLNCPWCGRDNGKFHLGINPSTYQTSCWQCGPHNLTSTIIALSSSSPRDVFLRCQELDLKKWEGLTKPQTGSYKPPHGVGQLMKAHRRYLKARGFNPDQLSRLWNIGGIGLSGSLRWRVFIPIMFREEAVSWTTRSIGESSYKYISAKPEEESIPHKSLLFGADLANAAVIVVEGAFDAFRLGPGAVATLGLNVTQEQIWRISNYPIRVIAFDSEPKAQKKARQLADELSCFPGRTGIIELDAADPGQASPKEVRLVRRCVFSERA